MKAPGLIHLAHYIDSVPDTISSLLSQAHRRIGSACAIRCKMTRRWALLHSLFLVFEVLNGNGSSGLQDARVVVMRIRSSKNHKRSVTFLIELLRMKSMSLGLLKLNICQVKLLSHSLSFKLYSK